MYSATTYQQPFRLRRLGSGAPGLRGRGIPIPVGEFGEKWGQGLRVSGTNDDNLKPETGRGVDAQT